MYGTNSSLRYKIIKSTDINFMFCPDGMTLVPRASLEISLQCPDHYKSIIADAFDKGWLKPIAHIPVHEHFMEELTK